MPTNATSSGQHDSGVFELNFKDERYMPFEGAGAISKWRLALPDTFRQFKYETISDIIVHISYTSKDGGDKLQRPATDALIDYIKNVSALSQREGLFALFDLKNDFPNEWYKAMLIPPGAGGRLMQLGNLADRLPFYTKNIGKITATDIYFALDASFKITDLTIIKTNPLPGTMSGPVKISNTTNLYHLSDQTASMDKAADTWSLKFGNSITEPDKIWMVVRYTLG